MPKKKAGCKGLEDMNIGSTGGANMHGTAGKTINPRKARKHKFSRIIDDLRLSVNHQVRKIRNRQLACQFDPLDNGYQPPVVDSALYDQYYREADSRHQTSYGSTFIKDVFRNLDFRTVLDAGCGSGILVRRFLEKGYVARGIELSEWVVQSQCPDLLRDGIVQVGSLVDLPYRDNSFDLVFSSDVLEHIPEELIPRVVSELVRVSRGAVFMSISLRPSSMNNKYHVTLKPRSWWEEQFLRCGVTVATDLLDRFQARIPGASNREVLESGLAPRLLDEMSWFVDQQPYQLNGELEPWFFAFEKPAAAKPLQQAA
jgi:2-polyprenyl-3-methyl-5-hydroxy-6-metoxy-1,4-benzoquinol methylase